MASKPINLARASREELLDFIEETGTTFDEKGMSDADVRAKAMEIQDNLAEIGEAAEIERKAKEASKGEREKMAQASLEMLKSMKAAGIPTERVEKLDLDSLEAQPFDGKAKSIHAIVESAIESRLGDYNPTNEQRAAEEKAKEAERMRNLYALAAADREISLWHAQAQNRHGAKLTNVCFFLLDGMHLASFWTGFTKVPGVRLQKSSPYRALDSELKIFRRKKGFMFGECAYEGADQTELTSEAPKRGRPKKK